MSPPIKPKGFTDMRGTFFFTAKREPLFDFGEAIGKLTAQVKELEAYKADIENACKMAMDEKCSADQQHCTCVPLLREKVKELEDRVQKQSTRIRAFGYGWQEGDKTRIQELEAENEKLRKLLWLRHGCQGLYGDDGEMQCSQCMLDFKRDSVEKISQRFTEQGLKQALEERTGEDKKLWNDQLEGSWNAKQAMEGEE